MVILSLNLTLALFATIVSILYLGFSRCSARNCLCPAVDTEEAFVFGRIP